ncbi:MAG: substrate-binding domain-containing protein [Capsulimonadaceae bacterium]|nr:substrate-binding domain-containing protein [Capsulimonadaceae bacterium]
MTVDSITKPARSSRKHDLLRVEQEMRHRIAASAWLPGDLLPSRRDLAQEFGVDLNTIQRAMAPMLSDGTLRAENGRGTFVSENPSWPASAHTTGAPARTRTKTVGVTAFLDEIAVATGKELPATMTVVKAIESQASALGANTVFYNRWGANREEISPTVAARELLAQGCESVFVIDVYTHPYVLSEMRSAPDLASQPIVYVSNVGEYVPCAHVFYDNRDAGYRAADRLCAEGYREITFLAPYAGEWPAIRADGARIACESWREPVKFNVTPLEERFEFYSPGKEGRTNAFVDRLIDENKLKGGIIAAHDALALRIMERAEMRGIVAGRDYGLVGFDDEPRAIARGLTTIRPPLEELGAEAVRLMTSWSTPPRTGIVVSLRANVVERSTHKKP